jgi:hypothetical protein
MNRIFAEHGLLSDTANLDFTAIPYWGDDDPFENNWSGKRAKALISIQAALAQDPDTGILCYGDTTVKHDNQDDVVLEITLSLTVSLRHWIILDVSMSKELNSSPSSVKANI